MSRMDQELEHRALIGAEKHDLIMDAAVYVEHYFEGRIRWMDLTRELQKSKVQYRELRDE